MSFMVYKVVWKVPRAPTPWESNALCKYMNKSPIRQPQFSEHFSLHIQTRTRSLYMFFLQLCLSNSPKADGGGLSILALSLLDTVPAPQPLAQGTGSTDFTDRRTMGALKDFSSWLSPPAPLWAASVHCGDLRTPGPPLSRHWPCGSTFTTVPKDFCTEQMQLLLQLWLK